MAEVSYGAVIERAYKMVDELRALVLLDVLGSLPRLYPCPNATLCLVTMTVRLLRAKMLPKTPSENF